MNGTPGYMAPEVIERTPYDGQSVDLFACGVILFSMLTGIPPFMAAEREDMFYRQIMEKTTIFWKAHNSGKTKGFFSDEFKHLFSSMVAHDPKERLCLADVIGHPWLQGDIATPEEVKAEMAEKHDVIKNRNAEKEAEKLAEKQIKQVIREKR